MDYKLLARKYIGKPFKSGGRGPKFFDCWGIVIAFMKDINGPELESYDKLYKNVTDGISITRIAEQEIHSWYSINGRELQPGDVPFYKMGPQQMHVGIMVNNNTMLNSCLNIGAVIERYDSALWKQRLIGVYRHVEMLL